MSHKSSFTFICVHSKKLRLSSEFMTTSKQLDSVAFRSPRNRSSPIKLHSPYPSQAPWRPTITTSTLRFKESNEIWSFNFFFIVRVKRLIWLRQLGLLNHWANSFLPRPYQCSAPLASLRPTSNERLTLNYLSSAFLLYGVGVGVSILAFVLEVISTWWNATTRVKSFGSRHSRINA
jgi:hypothetical protein